MSKVLITDFAWPDTSIERGILEAAGHTLVEGPAVAADAETIEDLVREHMPDAIMTNWAPVSAAAIELSPGLKVVARLGVGLDNIDVTAASRRGVWVTNVPDYCIEEVSDQAIALLLAWTRGVVAFDREVKAGTWNPAGARLRRLSELTVGISGFGRIGRRTAAKLKGWGCRIIVHDAVQIADRDVNQVPFHALLAESDAIIVHVPLLPETHHLFNHHAFTKMKPGAFLINVSRGPVVDAAALEAALRDGTVAGAGLDVVEGEPNAPRGLAELPQAIMSPHVAFSSDASLVELRERTAQCVVSALKGDSPPMNACNHPKPAPAGS